MPMTLEVYRMGRDGTKRPVSPRIVVGGPGGPPGPREVPISSGYPPCGCPRCSGQRFGDGRR
ncbi:hypothetical protein [Streptomyces amakusaensis]|uniref:Uncharacterized protein n=1 Tax=Streptomyces amakusaensis TaxID=67271 RepID=A0ABW0ADV2_9ACTN